MDRTAQGEHEVSVKWLEEKQMAIRWSFDNNAAAALAHDSKGTQRLDGDLGSGILGPTACDAASSRSARHHQQQPHENSGAVPMDFI